MGKKRKASGQVPHSREPRDASLTEGKLRVGTFEDVVDSEDEFHINRDKILLEEGPLQKRQRKAREDDGFLEFSDEEVLSAPPSIGEPEDLDESEEQELADLQTPARPAPYTDNGPTLSDSEASQLPSDDNEVDGWGTAKSDYYNADVIETEADAREEEAEVRRLQQKYLQGMTEADFGFDEADWLEAGKEDQGDQVDEGEAQHGVPSDGLLQLEITDAMSPDERLNIFRRRYPEFEPLAQEFLNLQPLHEDLGLAAATALQTQGNLQANGSNEEKLPVAVIKHRTLGAYLAALCLYFTILTSTATAEAKTVAMSPSELRDHPIMDSLVQCRELWLRARDLIVPEPVASIIAPSENNMEHDKLLLTNGTEEPPTITKPKKRKSKAERAAARAQEEAKNLRLERLRETESSLASLSDLTKNVSKPPAAKAAPKALDNGDDSDFGDPTHLEADEAAQKAECKKSLKFYTSQIVSKSQKRGAAGRDAGGDADIPYKERLKDRQERLNAQAEKRGTKRKPNEQEALGGESDEEDAKAAAEIRNGGEEDYYDLVAGRSSAKKAAKAKLAAEQAAAVNGLARIPAEETDGDEGKRAISYAIEKNKGLHPKRKKEVRNPRVKKRKKFEEKKKRLSSIRPVYRGGEGKGYQGEVTGIKGGLIAILQNSLDSNPSETSRSVQNKTIIPMPRNKPSKSNAQNQRDKEKAQEKKQGTKGVSMGLSEKEIQDYKKHRERIGQKNTPQNAKNKQK
ncbi:MAG: hypothetical protein Q9195_003887 [Heterodermia aff. obscurata]